MAADSRDSQAPVPAVRLPVSRAKAWRRAATMLVPAAAILLYCISQIMGLNLKPSPVSNRLPEYAWLTIYLGLGLLGLRLAWRGAYWSLVAGWFHDLAITIDSQRWVFELGPMGRREFDSIRVKVRYPDDDPEAGEDGLAEALRDPEAYREQYLPQFTHPQSRDRLDQMIRHLTAMSEPELARQLLPFVSWRRLAMGLDDDAIQTADES